MRFEKLEGIELAIDDDRQTPVEERIEDDESAANLDRILNPIEEKKNFWTKLFPSTMDCRVLFGFICLLMTLNIQYFEINQICPYKTDFDCFYRYLACEDDCSDLSTPLFENLFDFTATIHRFDGFFLKTRLAHIISKLVIISLTFSLIVTLGIFKKGARLFILAVAVNIYYLNIYRDGEQHGDYTHILGSWLTILVVKLALVFAVMIIIGKINSRGKGYAWAVFVTINVSIMFAIYGVAQRVTTNCENWDKGLYGETIDNTVNCQFTKPGFCMYEFIGDIYDYNQWLGVTCEDKKPHWDLMDLKYPNTSKVGFPNLRDLTKPDRQVNKVPIYVDSHLRAVNETNEKDFEVVLHRTFDSKTKTYRGPAWIDVNVQFNQELVAQRSTLVSESIVDNVLVIYIDTLSRAAAFRSLPKTMGMFEKMSPKVHQFFKYHSITPYTIGNMYAMYYGMERPSVADESAQEKQSFIHEYKNKGFITGRALSHCAISSLDTVFEAKFFNMVDEELFDHMANGWACDANARPLIYNEVTSGPSSVLHRCIYGKEMSEYVIDYGKKFWKTYKNQKKFLWLDFLDFHDITFSNGKHLDPHLSKFLGEMDLKDTLLMLISDHGQHIFKNPALKTFQSTVVEKAAPTLFVKLPENLESIYGDGLEKNKQQIVQAFDLHRLFTALPNPNQIKDTIFYPLPPKKTDCDFPLIDQQCQCKLPPTI